MLHSLRRKQHLSAEDSNAEVLPAHEPTTATRSPPDSDGLSLRQLSKAQQRKLRQVEAAAERRERVDQALQTLSRSSLPNDHLPLFRPVAQQGQRETKRQRLRRELAAERTEQGKLPFHKAKLTANTTRGQDPGMQPATSRAAPGPAINVAVRRTPEIVEARSGLPIMGMEQEVVETVGQHDVVVLCGETGCGKTTQVPQFLYEAGYGSARAPGRQGRIGVTQPRRVAAAASARRVAQELDCALGSTVGFQVRYEARTAATTAIKFMTDGILLREVQGDFLLNNYSCIIIDEAHERSLNTDLLLGLLSRIVKLRRKLASAPADPAMPPPHPLKLIIMSATLRTGDFVGNARLFETPPPVINVPARQYPVAVHFNRRTELHDYVGSAHRKVCQIHRQLPPGGILVFVTGQREVQVLCKRIRAAFAPRRAPQSSLSAPAPQDRNAAARPDDAGAADVDEGSEQDREVTEQNADGEDVTGLDAAEDDVRPMGVQDAGEGSKDDDYEMGQADEEDEDATRILGGPEGFSLEELQKAETEEMAALRQKAAAAGRDEDSPQAVHVLPLYAMLPATAQARVFGAVPEGARLIVVATNVAETSLTIPGIRYVVDCGRSKQKLLDAGGAAVARYQVRWISQASAAQRAGRSGRTGPGHCYRLYSSAFFSNTFPEHTLPEIVNSPLEGVVLTMKALGIDRVQNFPFPLPPESKSLAQAQAALVAMGALEGDGQPQAHNNGEAALSLTRIGRAMAALPLPPRHARMLLQILQGEGKAERQAVPYAVALAAALSAESPFVHIDSLKAADGGEGEGQGEGGRRQQRARAAHARLRDESGDALSALAALAAYQASGCSAAFCRDTFLHERHLQEMQSLHTQLTRALARPATTAMPHVGLDVKGQVSTTMSPAVRSMLCKALVCGWIDQVARRVKSSAQLLHQQQAHALNGKGKRRAVRYQAAMMEEEVYMHPLSALHKAAPEYLIYTQIIQTDKRPYMSGMTQVEARWLSEPVNPLCILSEPLDEPPANYSAKRDAVVCWHAITFGPRMWQLPSVMRNVQDPAACCTIFARALLEGSVLPALKGVQQALAASPSLMTTPQAQSHPRAVNLTSALRQHSISSKASLHQAWSRGPTLLQQELEAWLRKLPRDNGAFVSQSANPQHRSPLSLASARATGVVASAAVIDAPAQLQDDSDLSIFPQPSQSRTADSLEVETLDLQDQVSQFMSKYERTQSGKSAQTSASATWQEDFTADDQNRIRNSRRQWLEEEDSPESSLLEGTELDSLQVDAELARLEASGGRAQNSGSSLLHEVDQASLAASSTSSASRKRPRKQRAAAARTAELRAGSHAAWGKSSSSSSQSTLLDQDRADKQPAKVSKVRKGRASRGKDKAEAATKQGRPRKGSVDQNLKSAPFQVVFRGQNQLAHKLLTMEEEQFYAKIIIEARPYEDKLVEMTESLGRTPTMQEWAGGCGQLSEMEEFEDLIKRGRRARAIFEQCNMRLVAKIAYKFIDRGLELEDLMSYGMGGLNRAIDRFEPERGFKFSTYAHWWIRQVISRAVCDKGRTIRIPCHLHDLRSKAFKRMQIMATELMREPTTAELAASLNVTERKIEQLSRVFKAAASLEAPLKAPGGGDSADTTLTDTIAVGEEPEESSSQVAVRAALDASLSTLDARERIVVRMRYGLDDGCPRTLEDIGKYFKVTRERVRQIESKAFRKICQPGRLQLVDTTL
ncbi:hypothetical protein WJX73_005276 [Symbiochloris irregularis]|uniref:RNA helicase n=1 Tax=Symbiochloris irregularis TaxID=706552 RepID=A0AAW1NTS7_9CHLO